MKNISRLFLLLYLCLILTACSGEGDGNNNAEAKKDHVWKEQTDTIDKAREVEGMIFDSAENARKTLEKQEQ